MRPRKSPRNNNEKQDEKLLSTGNNLRATVEKEKGLKARKELDFDKAANQLRSEAKTAKGKNVVMPRRTRNAAVLKQSTTTVLQMFGALVHMRFKSKDDQLTFLIDDDVYGIKRSKAYIGLTECEAFLTMDWLHNSVIETFSA